MRYTVTEDTKIKLDGELFVLEKGDKITIENKVPIDDEYYGQEIENPEDEKDLPKPEDKLRRKDEKSHLQDEEEKEHEYDYKDENNVDTSLDKRKTGK